MINNQEVESNIVDNLRKVQEGISTLETAIKGMKGKIPPKDEKTSPP
jgi:hypothetical protein